MSTKKGKGTFKIHESVIFNFIKTRPPKHNDNSTIELINKIKCVENEISYEINNFKILEVIHNKEEHAFEFLIESEEFFDSKNDHELKIITAAIPNVYYNIGEAFYNLIRTIKI